MRFSEMQMHYDQKLQAIGRDAEYRLRKHNREWARFQRTLVLLCVAGIVVCLAAFGFLCWYIKHTM